MELLNAKREEIRELEEKLADLREKFDEVSANKERIEAEVNLCSMKLERAEKLIGKLFPSFFLISSF